MNPEKRKLKQALHDLRNGRPVLVYDFDGREGEVDMVYAAENILPESIARLRNDAGGLICTAVAHEVAERLGLPFYAEMIDHPAAETAARDYGDRSSFSLWVNREDTYTGITDKDRAKTVAALASIAADTTATADDFADTFTTPGHVAVLRASEGLLQHRQGHTEMSVYLVQKANLAPTAVIAEMLDGETGESLSKEDAEQYAAAHNLVLLTGEEVTSDFEQIADKVGL